MANPVEQDQIVVVGSRLKGRGAGSDALPVVTIYRDDFSRLGATNVADALKEVTQQPFSLNEQSSVAASRTSQLRGLAPGNTLVLINGRRATPSAQLAVVNYFDLNTVPLSAVERIEVLSDSASAVYGSDAVGGVVNVVLRDGLQSPFVEAYYGEASGGAEEVRGALGFGMDGERFRFTTIFDYFDRGFLLGSEVDQAANADFRRFGGQDMRVPIANPGNIQTLDGSNLPGLNAPIAGVPRGSTGVGLTPADFAATQGLPNRDSILRFSSPIPDAERMSATFLGEFDITDSITTFAEVLYADREETSLSVPNIVAGVVSPANPFNPFGVPVIAQFLLTGAPTQQTLFDSEALRSVIGVRGEFGSGWEWEVSGLNFAENSDTVSIGATDPLRVAAALNSTDPNTALNVFQDGPGGSPQLLASLIAPPQVTSLSADSWIASAFIRGMVPFDLPAGQPELVFGGEYRRDGISFASPPVIATFTADRNVSAAFTEVRIPLVSEDMDVPLMSNLAISLAGRYDDYSDFGGEFNPDVNLEWRLVPSFMVRASYGTAFRAPTLVELYQPQTVSMLPVLDPRRGNLPAQVTILNQGNPNLQAEESDSTSVGFVFTPGTADLFRLSVDYYEIDQDNRIQTFTQNDLIANEALFPNRVVRAPQTPADIAAGQPGQLVSLDVSGMNFGVLNTKGIDVQMSSSINTGLGTFVPTLSATYVLDYESQNFQNTPVIDRVGVANSSGTIPEFRATAGVQWTRQALTIGATARYIDSYDDVDQLGVRTNTKVDSQTFVDAQVGFDFERAFSGSAVFSGLTARLGVVNLTDEDLNFSQVQGLRGYDASLADVRGRFGYLAIQKSF